MSARINPPQVGAPDPELRTSSIMAELDWESETLKQEQPGEPVCYFNDVSYPNGTYVRSGSTLLRCNYGIWVEAGSSDSSNP